MHALEGTTHRWRVLLADDHAMLLDGLAMLVSTQPDMEVVAQVRSGREAVHMTQQLQPDVAVLDVSMPDVGGAEAAERIHVSCPEVHVLALTRHAEQGYLQRMLRAGAAGYVVKRAAGDALIGAIRTVAGGGTYIDPSLAGPLVARLVHQPGQAPGTRNRVVLSEREEQVLRLVAWGKSNKEVATQLGISVKTVEFYRAGALDKLQLRSRTDLLRHALTERWIGGEDEPE
jgi:DNA-binding NarL/FixJ family response regulator